MPVENGKKLQGNQNLGGKHNAKCNVLFVAGSSETIRKYPNPDDPDYKDSIRISIRIHPKPSETIRVPTLPIIRILPPVSIDTGRIRMESGPDDPDRMGSQERQGKWEIAGVCKFV